MSHLVKQKNVLITDLAALGRVLPKLGLQMRSAPEGMAFAYRWYGRSKADPKPVALRESSAEKGIAPHVLSVVGNPDAYEAGLVAAGKDGGYTVAFDNFSQYGKALESKLGAGCGRLYAAYNEEVVTAAAAANSYEVERAETDEEIVLTLGAYT